MTDAMERADVLFFTGVFVAMAGAMVVYAVIIGTPHGPLPLLAALFVVAVYESPIADRYKAALGER